MQLRSLIAVGNYLKKDQASNAANLFAHIAITKKDSRVKKPKIAAKVVSCFEKQPYRNSLK